MSGPAERWWIKRRKTCVEWYVRPADGTTWGRGWITWGSLDDSHASAFRLIEMILGRQLSVAERERGRSA